MRTFLVFMLGVAALTLSAPTPATAQRAGCDFEYVVQAGDTLPLIAETAFGQRTYSLIYARNLGKISNPSDLAVGETIIIPCLPGDASQIPDIEALQARMDAGGSVVDAAEAEPAVEVPAETEVVASVEAAQEDAEEEIVVSTTQTFTAPPEEDAAPRVRFLTASGQPPFADEGLRNGGMASELASRAMRRFTEADGYEIIFINDRDKHLRELLLKGSFDVAFPWVKPTCERVETWRAAFPVDAWMCDNLAFSEPFYEVVSGFFVRRGEFSNRSTWDDFVTASICRPNDQPVKDLALNGITDELAQIMRPDSARECVEMLMAGDVDAISADVFEVETAIFEMGVEGQTEEIPDLSVLTTYNAVAPLDNAESLAALDTLNQGMLELKISGEWFRVVTRHLAQN